jgi:hypothetical protein
VKLGILAYGSLIAEPGKELEQHIVGRIKTQTPFEVELARSSKRRAGAPTLVPVPDGKGCQVQAYILVLDNEVAVEEACNILYRREINCVGEKSVIYNDERQRSRQDKAVVIEKLHDFEGVELVLYTSLPPNIDILNDDSASPAEKASELAHLAKQSVTKETFCCQRDGIRYLADAICHGIQTLLTEPYRQAVLRLVGDAPDLEEARLRIARQKCLISQEER